MFPEYRALSLCSRPSLNVFAIQSSDWVSFHGRPFMTANTILVG